LPVLESAEYVRCAPGYAILAQASGQAAYRQAATCCVTAARMPRFLPAATCI